MLLFLELKKLECELFIWNRIRYEIFLLNRGKYILNLL
jgi:hypothetical protein